MPYMMRKMGDEFCVFKQGADGEPMGDSLGCHASEAEAQAQMAAIHANEDMNMNKSRRRTTAVAIKAMTDDTLLVAGYGVVYGGADLTGERFGPDTNYMLDLVPAKLILYDHGLNERVGKAALGRTTVVTPNADGLWVEAELDRHADYMQHVEKLLRMGVLGWSSGSVAHLAQRAGKSITYWPIIEFSLTPTPAEPRTLGVEVLKSLAQLDTALQAFLPEGAAATAPVRNANVEPDAPPRETVRSTKGPSMEPEVKAVATPVTVPAPAPQVDIEAIVNAAVTKALAVQPATNNPGYAVATDRPQAIKGMPAINTTGLGDNETKAIAYYVRTGDPQALALKASNNTDMNIGTAADGGYAVPTGHYQGIIARRDEMMLATQLGVMRIPGKGTTVNVPVDNEADGEFVSTAETVGFDQDAPALNQVAMTLVKYSKKIVLSYELLEDEDSRLMAFLDDFVGRGLAKTHNSLLVTAAGSGGTAALTLDSATTIAESEIPELAYKLPDPYQDGNIAWLMRRATEGIVRSNTGDMFSFAPTPAGSGQGGARAELWGWPVYNSDKVAAVAASAKSIFFGDWRYMGLREAPQITFLRDPYTLAVSGQVALFYYFRAVYSVLQAEAIIYATHPTA